MFRSRASRRPARAAIVAIFALLVSALPASAVSPGVTLTTAASPFDVTVSLPVAYVVDLHNGTNNALKFVTVSGETSTDLGYLGASPASCDQTAPSCDFSGLPKGQSAQAIFYFQAPDEPGSFTFTALANFDGQTPSPPANYQHALSKPVETVVLAKDQNSVTGHSFAGFRSFTTGLDNLSSSNKHGTSVVVPTNAEVRVRDLPATPCTNLVGEVDSLPCFGEASYLSVADGAAIPGGIKVTMRWDASDLPKGMTEKKLQIVHIFDDNTYELVTAQCTFVGGTPTNLPCLDGSPIRLADKDIQATIYLLTNATVRGW